MDEHALEYYRSYSKIFPHAHFHDVKFLHEDKTITWQESQGLDPQLCRGWYELAQLDIKDRIDFICEFWCTKFSNYPEFIEFLIKFFNNIDDIGVIMTQQCFADPYTTQIVYSIKDDGGFYRGNAPITENEIISLQKVFTDYILPADYIEFLKIHNGFSKLTDSGINKSTDMLQNYNDLQKVLERGEPVRTTSGVNINPKALIPFYKSFDMPFYQCFCGEWYPDQEMGNVYYSGITHTISDFTIQDDKIETMAFNRFIDWLVFYLEKIV